MSSKNNKGLFVTFEGIEGSGKSTQIKLLAEKLRGMGSDVVTAREPGGTRAGDAVRSILLSPETGGLDPVTELLLFSAARRELVGKVIAPALGEGKIVLCDRFSDSTMAYQGYGRGLDMYLIGKVTDIAAGETRPDITIVLDLPVEEGLKRANGRMAGEGRGEARFEEEAAEFHARVREGFLRIARAEPGRVKVIETSVAPGKVHEAVLNAVMPEVSGRGWK